MILQNLHIKEEPACKTIVIKDRFIFSVTGTKKSTGNENTGIVLYFENAIAFPGLINSHDHLDFNLFPQTGNKKYTNYVEWGKDIHLHNKNEIDSTLNIPQALRVQWGIYKNLLNGVTSVVNHGAYLPLTKPVIDVFQNCYSLHSVQLEKQWKLKLNRPLQKNWPIVIHTGEGTDSKASEEIDQLIKWNIRKRKIIGVHGVAMSEQQAINFEGLIWCPVTNIFLLNKTAPVNLLKKQTRIVFGTDSTLTASWNIWEQLRIAKKLSLLSQDELYNTVTTEPAILWKLKNQGALKEKAIANIVIARRKKGSFLDSFFDLEPADILMVMQNGIVKLFDESLSGELKKANPYYSAFDRIKINNDHKYVYGNLPGLMRNILEYKADADFPFLPA